MLYCFIYIVNIYIFTVLNIFVRYFMSIKKTAASEKNVRLIIELSSKTRQELKSKAALEGLNMKEVVTKLIEGYLINKNKNKKF